MIAVAASMLLVGASALSVEREQMMFSAFKTQHGRKYESADEETTRFNIFRENLKVIQQRNAEERAAGGTAMHGVTKFADLSANEFRSRFNNLIASAPVNATYATVPVYTGSDVNVDWTGIYTTPVKDQGYCGSCWAFAATEQIESDSMRLLGTNYILAPQQLVSCDRTSMGCNGGLQERAYGYVQRTGGQELEVNYPYTSGAEGVTGSCSSDSKKYVMTVTGYTNVKGETDMMNYLKANGPLSIAVDASTWSSYTGGIMSACPKQINHAVQAVGVDTGSNPYWKVRNSWSADWGEQGYIRLAYGQDTCGITYDVTYVAPKSV